MSIDRTTIIVAHRLSTIRHADNIIVLDQGHVAEMGTHHSLMSQQGKYFQLVQTQLIENMSDQQSLVENNVDSSVKQESETLIKLEEKKVNILIMI
jgi:ATP-binding cassette subfamily B (MDR/TAP) protein 1